MSLLRDSLTRVGCAESGGHTNDHVILEPGILDVGEQIGIIRISSRRTDFLHDC